MRVATQRERRFDLRKRTVEEAGGVREEDSRSFVRHVAKRPNEVCVLTTRIVSGHDAEASFHLEMFVREELGAGVAVRSRHFR